jgi:transposase-like protein
VADDRTYIKLHDGMPGHPKVRGLSDKAFRCYVTALCYCSEYLTDGEVVSAVARDFGTARIWRELHEKGLVESTPGGYLMHDYLEHQRSAAQVRELKEKRRSAGRKGGQARSSGEANLKQVLQQVPEQTPSKTQAETETETEEKKTESSSRPHKRGTRVPENYRPPTQLIEFARSKGFTNPQIVEITEEFIDYWRAIPGQRGVKTDWDSTWRNSVRRKAELSNNVSPIRRTASGEEYQPWNP